MDLQSIVTKLLGTAVRHGLNALGAIILAKGWVSESVWESLAGNIEGVVAIIVAAALSYWFKKKAEESDPAAK